MQRSLLPYLVAVAAIACGGKQKSSTPPPPLPEPKVEQAKSAPEEEAKTPEAPPVPQGPIEVTLASPQVEVKLVNAGKGKKAALKLTPKVGTKQTTELALDFRGSQDGPPEVGGKKDDIAPTVVLVGDVETQEVAADGQTKFQMTVSSVDARDNPGQKVSSAEFKQELATLVGATFAGTVGANGAASDLRLKVEKPDAKSAGILEFVKVSMMPLWPVLPTEAIGPGAKWTVTSKEKLADQLEVKKVINYELVSKKGNTYTIKGTTTITGDDQTVQGAKLGAISGKGSSEVTLAEGALVPAQKQNVATGFTITATLPPEAGGPKDIQVKFQLEQTNTLTPKS